MKGFIYIFKKLGKKQTFACIFEHLLLKFSAGNVIMK